MQVGGITCTSQRFALTRCRCSSEGKKPRHRKSKEERRVMVETFVTKFRNTNNGNFPSLNITHKEVGGSYYIVRDIMRDIIQENRVLGPGDLNMQSLTLEDVPVEPEVCENANNIIGSDVHLETGNEEAYIDVESLKQGSNVSIETLEKKLLENEHQILESSNGKHFEQMEVLEYKSDNSNLIMEENRTDSVGKQPTDDVLETGFHKTGDVEGSVMNMITERLDGPKIDTKTGEVDEVLETDGPLSTNEAIKVDSFVGSTETSNLNEGFIGSMSVENGDIQESVMEMKKKAVTESKSDIEEVPAEAESGDAFAINKSKNLDSCFGPTDLNVGVEVPSAIDDLQESVGQMATETIDSEIKKDERDQSSESNNKMSINGNKKSSSLEGSAETWDSNGGLEMSRTVVEVEQFPPPQANSSLNSEVPDCVSASAGVEEREMESVDVKDPVAVITKTEMKPALEDQSTGKIIETVPNTEQGDTLDNSTKNKGRELNPITPINEYLLHRHESHLKLDYLTRELSMDASSNREGDKKTRAKVENNPLWNTLRAFVTAFIKFWSE